MSPASSVGSSHERSHRAAGLDLSQSGPMTTSSPITAIRTRTMSQPSLPTSTSTVRARRDSLTGRPGSSLSQQRLSSLFHSPKSPRAGSPALSVSSRASSREGEADGQQTRERNWNSPRPKWEPPSDKPAMRERRRSQIVSPVPSLQAEHRDRAGASPPSLYRRNSAASNGSETHASPAAHARLDKASHVTDPIHTINGVPRAISPADKRQAIIRTQSEIPSTSSSNISKVPTSSRQTEWTFPRSRSPIPPTPHDKNNSAHEPLNRVPQRTLSSPASRPGSRAADTGSTRSHLSTQANGTEQHSPAPAERRIMHRRSVTEYNESVGGVPPKVSFAAEPVLFASSESDSSPGKRCSVGHAKFSD